MPSLVAIFATKTFFTITGEVAIFATKTYFSITGEVQAGCVLAYMCKNFGLNACLTF